MHRVCASLALTAAILLAAQPATAADDDGYDGLPPGKGRDEVFGLCGACHSVRLVTQQGLPRTRWDKLIDWMIEEQGMPKPDAELRTLILNYLSEHLNIDHRPSHVTKTP